MASGAGAGRQASRRRARGESSGDPSVGIEARVVRARLRVWGPPRLDPEEPHLFVRLIVHFGLLCSVRLVIRRGVHARGFPRLLERGSSTGREQQHGGSSGGDRGSRPASERRCSRPAFDPQSGTAASRAAARAASFAMRIWSVRTSEMLRISDALDAPAPSAKLAISSWTCVRCGN